MLARQRAQRVPSALDRDLATAVGARMERGYEPGQRSKVVIDVGAGPHQGREPPICGHPAHHQDMLGRITGDRTAVRG
jgi:hypothetical protein